MALADLMQSDDESGTLMEFKAQRRGYSAEASFIDFSPLVDMTFQLLAFFVMTVKLASQEAVDVPPIARGEGIELDQSTVITMLAPSETYRETRILLGDGVKGSELTLERVREEVEASVNKKRPFIIIKAERLTPAGAVQRVCRIVASVPGAELYIGVKDKE
jgi:biopolymer transport protein ExbD